MLMTGKNDCRLMSRIVVAKQQPARGILTVIREGQLFQTESSIDILGKKEQETPSTNPRAPLITPILGVLASTLNSEVIIKSALA